jgi:eukaryotic-like serine/threonine-protein kinase
MTTILKKGEIVGGEKFGTFRIERALGQGEMGAVYVAHHIERGDLVALKVLHAHLRRDRHVVSRFKREGAIAATFDSPYLARLRRVVGVREEQQYWIAFEFLDGESLDKILARKGTLPFDEVSRLVRCVLSGLKVAHGGRDTETQVVHRDIKPANLLRVAADGRYVVLDFGISKLRTANVATLTTTHTPLGSYAFMAPEQVGAAAKADGRADLYALGIVVIACLTGRVPFASADATELLAIKTQLDVPPLSTFAEGLWPPPLEAFVTRLTHLKREHRFRSSGEALMAWDALVALSLSVPRVTVSSADALNDGNFQDTLPLARRTRDYGS